MHDAPVVGVREPLRDLGGKLERPRQGIAELLPPDELHGDERQLTGLANLVDDADVRAFQ
jgi:hypothetical protein